MAADGKEGPKSAPPSPPLPVQLPPYPEASQMILEEPDAASVGVPVVADDADGVSAPTAVVAPDAGGESVKRGRGRPPKLKTPVAGATVDATAAQVVASDAAAAPIKRGRGRPPKPKAPAAEATVDTAATSVKRGRGRPPKPKSPAAKATVVAAAEAVVASETSAETTVDVAADPVVSLKRGRGRPPKPKDPVAEAVAVATRGMPRARGRLPKKAKLGGEAPIGLSASSNGNADDANAVPVKRGRGRPPKVKL